MMDIVATVFTSRFRAIVTSGLKCTLEARRRFKIEDLELLRETHMVVSAGLLLNRLYNGESKLKVKAQHVKRSHGLTFDYSLYSEVLGETAMRAYGVKQELENFNEVSGNFYVKRRLPGESTWESSTLKLTDSSIGLTSEDLRSYLELTGQAKSRVYVNSFFSNLSSE